MDLAHTVVSELVARTGLSAGEVDDVVFGEAMYGGGVIARYAALTAGLGTVPGLALNRHCASSLAAVSTGAAGIASGMQDVVIAGGTYSQSTSPRVSFRDPHTNEVDDRWLSPSHPDSPAAPRDMSITVGWNTAIEAGLSRTDMDAWALESHRKAVAAIDDGRLAQEIVPLKIDRGDDGAAIFDVDEHPRRTSTLEKLAALPPLHPEIDGFSITAGNASGLNDAAAGVVLMAAERAAAAGLTPLASVRGWASVGVAPERTGMAPCDAIAKALGRLGMTVSDVDLWEINEAFASVPLATSRVLGIDPERINPVGSGCSLGHPIAATGARMVVSLVNELRRRGGGTGVATMCAAGGMGAALVLDAFAG